MEKAHRKWIDLHLHLDGSLSLATVKELADMQKIVIPETEDEIRKKLTVSEDCRNLNEYLDKFAFPCSLLQTREGITTAVYRLQEELKHQLLYAEIRFAPQKHCEKGLSQEEVVEAALEGLNRSDFPANLILCCMRGENNDSENKKTVEVAARYRNQGVCAIDLAGAEALYPTERYEGLFFYAKQLGIPYTIHAGEADGPESVRKALSFGANRIGHGVRSLEDPELIEYLAKTGIPLELCPTSNLNTAIYPDIHCFPLRELMDAGVVVTINTDNMSVSGTTMEKEMNKLRGAFDLTEGEEEKFVENGVRVSFASDRQKKILKKMKKGVDKS